MKGMWQMLLGRRGCGMYYWVKGVAILDFVPLASSLRPSGACPDFSDPTTSFDHLQLWHTVFTGKRLRQVSGDATKPAVVSMTLHNDQDSPVGMSRKFLRVIATWRKKYPVALLALLTMEETYIRPVQKFEKKSPSQSSVKSMFTPWNITLVLRVSMYSVWNLTAFAVRMLPANYYASSAASRMHHMAFDLLTSILGLIWRLLGVSPISSQLTPMSFPWFCRPSSATNIKIAARLLFFSLFSHLTR